MELIDEAISSGVTSLPVFPVAIKELHNALKDENRSFDVIAKQITMDANLAAQILRAANSSFYAGMSKINTLKEAILRLGLARVVQIATLVVQKGLFSSKNPTTSQFMNKLWQHSVAVALGSEWLANRLGFMTLAEEAFMAGLFHDIGKLLLLRCLEDICANNPTLSLPEELIYEVLVNQHEKKGSQLLQSWNLPEIYCSIAESHHQPLTDKTETVELLVRVANMVSSKLGIAIRPAPNLVVIGSEEACRLGLSEITLAELEIALEDALAIPL